MPHPALTDMPAPIQCGCTPDGLVVIQMPISVSVIVLDPRNALALAQGLLSMIDKAMEVRFGSEDDEPEMPPTQGTA